MIKIESQQILIPKQVYIGDRAELRVTFVLNSELAQKAAQSGQLKLSSEYFARSLDFTEYEIKSITLSNTGQNHFILDISFIPWRTGLIQFPEYNLTAALSSTKQADPNHEANSSSSTSSNASDLSLYFEPLEIVSLIGNGESATLKKSAPPLLLPGTIYRIYAQIIVAIILIIAIIRLIVKHKAINLFFKNRRLLRKYKKNRRATEKLLKSLLENKSSTHAGSNCLDDHDCAEQIQIAMRKYLEIRLATPFTHANTSEMAPLFNKTTQGLLPEQKEDAFYEIVAAFVRTDFIRYSKDAKFGPDEKSELIKKLLENINTLETEVREEKNAAL
ncbi:MAG: hypothetical protein K6A43_04260 [Treponema sp.]|nr:hypothetical protein [Treponema sp.]